MALSHFGFLPKNYQACLASFIFSISMWFCFHDNCPIYGLDSDSPSSVTHGLRGLWDTSWHFWASPRCSPRPWEWAQGLLSPKSSEREGPRINQKQRWLWPMLQLSILNGQQMVPRKQAQKDILTKHGESSERIRIGNIRGTMHPPGTYHPAWCCCQELRDSPGIGHNP